MPNLTAAQKTALTKAREALQALAWVFDPGPIRHDAELYATLLFLTDVQDAPYTYQIVGPIQHSNPRKRRKKTVPRPGTIPDPPVAP